MPQNTRKRKKKKLKAKTLWRVARRTLVSQKESPKRRAQSVALAAFMSFIPLYGLQTILGVFLAFVLRLNKLLVIVLINIITPYPLVPLIIYLSFKVGGWFVNNPAQVGKYESFSWQLLQDNLAQYLVGGLLLALAMGSLLGSLSYPLFVYLQKRTKNKANTTVV